MSRDLFLAILAMDAYNRGYGAGIKNLPELGALGNATILTTPAQAGWETAGFYAIAYEVSQVAGLSGTVVAYRGTDSPVDALAFELGIGQPFTPSGTLLRQARMTIELHRAVAGQANDPFAANITTTGHSLGGDLAGYAAMLYGKQGTLFADRASENAAAAMRATAVRESIVFVDQEFASGGGPLHMFKCGSIAGHARYREFLMPNRSAGATPAARVNMIDGPREPNHWFSRTRFATPLQHQARGRRLGFRADVPREDQPSRQPQEPTRAA